ncbi:NmrA family NAD(P)-binding protein [Paenibacillus pasadenensis]|uniref:SDR family oxidoreductase n=1 Tax=Paenibacillus pasadenensis TaxID=217090 RepID=UPI00203CD796|nr:NmrA family NAD(P)-binding protein [Paenibacillus pasadenensis]MCM3748579.1 NmrA family NAD(P)-binding protein [Paenibacillus pasadenensis]
MSENKKNVLVYGATGVQGGAVARKLVEAGYQVSALARTEEKAEQLRSAGIRAVIGELGNPQSLATAHDGIHIVYLQLPVLFNLDQVRQFIRNTVDAAKNAAVELLVVNTNSFVPESTTNAKAVELKRELKEAVKQSGLPYIFLQPTLYLENLCIPGIVQGNVLAYPVPSGMPIAWVSNEDAAQFALYAVNHPELAGQTIQVHGPEAVTGERLAELVGEALGRNVGFHSLAVSDFEAALAPFMGAENADGLASLYTWIGENGLSMPRPDSSPSVILDEVGGTPIAAWLKDVVNKGIIQ